MVNDRAILEHVKTLTAKILREPDSQVARDHILLVRQDHSYSEERAVEALKDLVLEWHTVDE